MLRTHAARSIFFDNIRSRGQREREREKIGKRAVFGARVEGRGLKDLVVARNRPFYDLLFPHGSPWNDAFCLSSMDARLFYRSPVEYNVGDVVIMVGYGWGLQRFSRSRNNSGLILHFFYIFKGGRDEFGEISFLKVRSRRYNSNVILFRRTMRSFSRFLKNFLFDIRQTKEDRYLYDSRPRFV